MAQITRLGEPVQIGSLRTKNRICIPPMVIFSCKKGDGYVTDTHLAHYRSLAQGGAGLIIQEATCVLPQGRLHDSQLGIWEDGQISGLRRITDTVHRENCPIFLQIHHSSVEHPESLQLHGVEEAFVAAGRRAFQAGYDGVELHGCHSYLLCQLLNRETGAGVDPMPMIGRIIAGIRAETSPEFIIGIRLGAFEPDLEAGIAHARTLEQLGIQFFDISFGFSGHMDMTVPGDDRFHPLLRAAGEIKKQVSVPVFGVQCIRSPEMGADVIEALGLDMIDVGRSALVDPDWPKKAISGKIPGKCLGCKVCQWRIDPEKCAGRRLMNKKEVNP